MNYLYLIYFGHIKWHNSLEKTILKGKEEGKRGWERPRRRRERERDIRDWQGEKQDIVRAGRRMGERSVYRRNTRTAVSQRHAELKNTTSLTGTNLCFLVSTCLSPRADWQGPHGVDVVGSQDSSQGEQCVELGLYCLQSPHQTCRCSWQQPLPPQGRDRRGAEADP